MLVENLKQYIQKFITVTLEDSSEVSGYISNPEEIKDGSALTLELVNGLQASSVEIERIIFIHEAVREDTLSIPIISDKDLKKASPQSFDDKLDELFNKSMDDVLEVKLPNGKVIDNTKKK